MLTSGFYLFLFNLTSIPLLWINLRDARLRRARMYWALNSGNWRSFRFEAISASNYSNRFFTVPNLFHPGTSLPGIYRSDEVDSLRLTTRPELACLASWKRLLLTASSIHSSSGWYLLMEDDLGSSLSCPESWVHSLFDLISFCPSNTLAIQLAPISATVRLQLFRQWSSSHGNCLAVPKANVRSHGNGAILLHANAIKMLTDPLLTFFNRLSSDFYPMLHPWRIRPVADKWLYGSLPADSCQVATFPLFCLDAYDSSIHTHHVHGFHQPSRDTTINIWREASCSQLLESLSVWDNISFG